MGRRRKSIFRVRARSRRARSSGERLRTSSGGWRLVRVFAGAASREALETWSALFFSIVVSNTWAAMVMVEPKGGLGDEED